MKPIEYGKGNIKFAEKQEEYETLPARRVGDNVVSCWRPTLRERLSLLFRGRLFLMVWTYGTPLQPVWLGTEDPVIEEEA